MKSVNSFEVTGFIVNDATVNKFDNASVARFGLAIVRTEGKDDKKKRTSASASHRQGILQAGRV